MTTLAEQVAEAIPSEPSYLSFALLDTDYIAQKPSKYDPNQDWEINDSSRTRPMTKAEGEDKRIAAIRRKCKNQRHVGGTTWQGEHSPCPACYWEIQKIKGEEWDSMCERTESYWREKIAREIEQQ